MLQLQKNLCKIVFALLFIVHLLPVEALYWRLAKVLRLDDETTKENQVNLTRSSCHASHFVSYLTIFQHVLSIHTLPCVSEYRA